MDALRGADRPWFREALHIDGALGSSIPPDIHLWRLVNASGIRLAGALTRRVPLHDKTDRPQQRGTKLKLFSYRGEIPKRSHAPTRLSLLNIPARLMSA
jgi:hypothetical protein